MKRKLLSLIIAFVLVGSGFVFGACGEQLGGYDLANLATDYTNQINDINNINLLTDKTIEFDYSDYVSDGDEYLLNAVNNVAPYTYIQSYYNRILDNSMVFVYEYIEVCSTDTIDAPKDARNELKENLDSFVLSLKTTSSNVEAVADKIRKGNGLLESECLNSLKNLFDSYDRLYQSAFNLSSSLSNIYYEYAYTNSNPDYSNTAVEDYDASKTLLLLKSRIKCQIANYTQSYVEINLKGSDLSTRFTTVGNIESLPSSFYNYQTNITIMDVEVDDTKGEAINNSASKEDFMNSAIAFHNAIATLENNYAVYYKASNDVIYNKVINDINATRYEKDCATIIANNAFVISEINTVIVRMINITNMI